MNEYKRPETKVFFIWKFIKVPVFILSDGLRLNQRERSLCVRVCVMRLTNYRIQESKNFVKKKKIFRNFFLFTLFNQFIHFLFFKDLLYKSCVYMCADVVQKTIIIISLCFCGFCIFCHLKKSFFFIVYLSSVMMWICFWFFIVGNKIQKFITCTNKNNLNCHSLWPMICLWTSFFLIMKIFPLEFFSFLFWHNFKVSFFCSMSPKKTVPKQKIN